MKNYSTKSFLGLKSNEEFIRGIQHSVDQIDNQVGIFTGDQMFTYHRNLGFLDDEQFMASFNANAKTEVERSLIWRYATLCWAAQNGMRLDGDFIEIACYTGTAANIIFDYVNFKASDKQYFLYDQFDIDDTKPPHSMTEQKNLYKQVQERFQDCPNVRITQGKVSETLAVTVPEKIAFMHLNSHHAEAKIGTLEVLFERLVPGAILVMDEYGSSPNGDQNIAEDSWLESRGYQVLELPTGQGIVIK